MGFSELGVRWLECVERGCTVKSLVTALGISLSRSIGSSDGVTIMTPYDFVLEVMVWVCAYLLSSCSQQVERGPKERNQERRKERRGRNEGGRNRERNLLNYSCIFVSADLCVWLEVSLSAAVLLLLLFGMPVVGGAWLGIVYIFSH